MLIIPRGKPAVRAAAVFDRIEIEPSLLLLKQRQASREAVNEILSADGA